MTQRFGTIVAFLSAIFFPWPLTALLALLLALFEPLVPLAIGIFMDALYYVPHGSFFPAATLWGALITALAFFVRTRLKTSIIG